LAYLTDLEGIDESLLAALCDLKVLIIGCLGMVETKTHLNLARVLEIVGRLKPTLTILTHMSHELEYEKMKKILPPHILPGYDGMIIDC
jgi:phosphoribosyl 1,2-cyclic phosphate phosphodiesterase